MSFIRELKRRSVFRVGAAYLVAAWLVVQVAETILPLFGFDEAPARMVVLVFAAGFLPALILAWLYEFTSSGIRRDTGIDGGSASPATSRSRLDIAIFGLLVIALVYFVVDRIFLEDDRLATTMNSVIAGIDDVRELAGNDQFAEAYRHAMQMSPQIRDESRHLEMLELVTTIRNIDSEPDDATVYFRPYDSTNAEWEELGRTPMNNVRLPRGVTRLKLERPGYASIHATVFERPKDIVFKLRTPREIPAGMTPVAGGSVDIDLTSLDYTRNIELSDYFIDTTEVTNEAFKAFIDDGGYETPDYWEHDFIVDNNEISFVEAMSMFVDKTGRPGPSSWEAGLYPEGQANHPVTGISWYEAAAYARYRERQLPTIYHWFNAAGALADHRLSIIEKSNFGGVGTVPVGSLDAISAFGALDMAGNVREWAWNALGEDRLVLGGSWRDPEYFFSDVYTQPPSNRDAANGVRLMLTVGDEDLTQAKAPVNWPSRDYTQERPVSDAVFEAYRSIYRYDQSPLNPSPIVREEVRRKHWIREMTEIDAAYNDERLPIYLYIPLGAEPPYSVVIYHPTTGAIHARKFAQADQLGHLEALVKDGRVLVQPVYKGTYERSIGLTSTLQDESSAYREHVIQWSKDLGRTIDYLETRSDMDVNRIGYMGWSWGGSIGPLMTAVENRIKVSIFVCGGLEPYKTQPEVDPFNFLPRVSAPTAVITTQRDPYWSPEIVQQFFQLVGSEKELFVSEIKGHCPPRNYVAQVALNWFDRYLGPTR